MENKKYKKLEDIKVNRYTDKEDIDFINLKNVTKKELLRLFEKSGLSKEEQEKINKEIENEKN